MSLLFYLGAITAFVLIALLLLTLVNPDLRIWPTPGAKTWQSYVFWPLFRALNVLCFAVAIVEYVHSEHLTGRMTLLGMPEWLCIAAAALGLASIALFVYAFRVLGRDNSYGASDGLVTGGIYQWTRNPQNALLMLVYACLAFASDSLSVWVLCTAMIAVYFLMVLLEEPWLDGIYGKAYREYCAAIPRFFNWGRLLGSRSAATR